MLQFNRFCTDVEKQLLKLCAVLLTENTCQRILCLKMKGLQFGDLKTMQKVIFEVTSITFTVVIGCIIFFGFFAQLAVINRYNPCYYTGTCFMYFLFTVIFIIILWFGFIYSKKMETLIHQIEETLSNPEISEKTSLLEKKTTTRKCCTTNIYEGPALVHGFNTILPQVLNI